MRWILYPQRAVGEDPRMAAWITADAMHRGAKGRLNWSAGVVIEGLTERDYQGPFVDLADRHPRRPVFSISDLSLRLALAPGLGIEAGRLRPTWATTDGFSPADGFLPRDLTDPFVEKRLPLWGVRAEGERGRLRAELFHAFTTTPWRLPLMTGRLSPGWYVDVYFEDATEPPPRNGFTLGRAQLTLGAWDISGWVRGGTRPAPVLEIDLPETLETSSRQVITMHRHFTTERAAGLGVSRVITGWVLRGEVAHLESPDADVGRALTWSLGADRPARNGVFTVTLAGNAIEPRVDPLVLPDRAFLPYFVATSTQEEEWGRWTITWLATLRRVGGVVTANLERPLTGDVTAAVGADLPHGSRSSSPGAISRARRVHAGIQWRW